MRSLLSLMLLANFAVALRGGPIEVGPTGVNGHHMGESVSAFLAIEPRLRHALDSCRRNPARSQCDSILDALARRRRAEISTSSSSEFVFDQGTLIKLVALVNGSADSVALNLTKSIGPRASEMDIQKRNASGDQWNDSLSVWTAPDAYILLFEDKNPSLSARHRPVVVIESPAEHARNASNSVHRGAALKGETQKAAFESDPRVVHHDF